MVELAVGVSGQNFHFCAENLLISLTSGRGDDSNMAVEAVEGGAFLHTYMFYFSFYMAGNPPASSRPPQGWVLTGRGWLAKIPSVEGVMEAIGEDDLENILTIATTLFKSL